MSRTRTAFFDLAKTPSGSFPRIDEAAAERRCKHSRRIGLARVRIHKKRYKEVDFSFPAGVQLPRFRIYCRTWGEAYTLAHDWTARIRQHGALVRALSAGQVWVAAECIRLLGPFAEKPEIALLDIVREYLRRHPLSGMARTLDDVRKEVVALKSKTGRSDRHVAGLDYKLRKLVGAIGNKPMALVTTQDLMGELCTHPTWKPTTVHSAVQSWKIMLNFAVKRGYIVENPANRIELPKIIHDEPQIFTVKQVGELMAATLFDDRHALLPECRAYLAIGMFAGLRPEEIERLEWCHVDMDTATIRVKAANAKDRDRRVVDISSNLSAWLRPVARCSGRVLTRPLAELRALARSILGFAEWPHDIMRHTFASYHFGEHRNEALTKHQMGHRDDGRIFYNHYCVPVGRREARQFWSIVPPRDVLPCMEPQWLAAHPPVRLARAAA